ncbi:Uncharacterised protein [Bordetella pertussis]|nr:Uncharacterised protein [Bordetella pertussis]CFP60670.1 Uncharacterised protein [Bordetella pertussis]
MDLMVRASGRSSSLATSSHLAAPGVGTASRSWPGAARVASRAGASASSILAA